MVRIVTGLLMYLAFTGAAFSETQSSQRLGELFRLFVTGLQCVGAEDTWTESDLGQLETLHLEQFDATSEQKQEAWMQALLDAKGSHVSPEECLVAMNTFKADLRDGR